MAVYSPTYPAGSVSGASASTLDIAGSAWPVYKLEALAAGVFTALPLALITGSGQLAVLAAATVVALVWIVGARRPRGSQRW